MEKILSERGESSVCKESPRMHKQRVLEERWCGY